MQMDLLDNPKIKQIKSRYLLLALIPAVLLLIAFISCTTIDSGSVGIRFKKWSSDASQYGGVLGTCKGWVWYNPITQKIFEYPIYVQRKTYEPFRVNAKDASEFTMDPTIAYRLDRPYSPNTARPSGRSKTVTSAPASTRHTVRVPTSIRRTT